MGATTLDAVAFSDLINKPVATIRRLLYARRLRLVRRDAEDLVLISAATYDQQAAVMGAVTLMIVSLARRRESLGNTVDSIVADGFPWVRFLPPNEVREFTKELTETLQAADSIDNLTPVSELIAQWRHTAEIYADPDLYAALTSDSDTDYGPVPEPVKAGR
jgi:hypothetical protein